MNATTVRHPTTDTPRHPKTRLRFRRAIVGTAIVLAGATTVAACGGSSTSTPATQATIAATGTAGGPTAPPVTNGAASPAGGQVLPVTVNPINNASTEQILKLDSILVENNVDPATGKDADDHLEVALTNTGTADLGGVEIFYTFTDPADGVTENYYTRLPAGFVIPAGGQRIAHFDNTGMPDHFPVSDFSIYKTSVNALDVTVIASATGAAPQTLTIQKDAGGAETAD